VGSTGDAGDTVPTGDNVKPGARSCVGDAVCVKGSAVGAMVLALVGVWLDVAGSVVGPAVFAIDGDGVASLEVATGVGAAVPLVALEEVGDTEDDGCAVARLGTLGETDDFVNDGFS
jgi:hypothetical protein